MDTDFERKETTDYTDVTDENPQICTDLHRFWKKNTDYTDFERKPQITQMSQIDTGICDDAVIFHFQFSAFHFPFSIFNFPFSVFNFQFSIFSFQFSVFNFQFSVFNFHLSTFSFQFSVFNFSATLSL